MPAAPRAAAAGAGVLVRPGAAELGDRGQGQAFGDELVGGGAAVGDAGEQVDERAGGDAIQAQAMAGALVGAEERLDGEQGQEAGHGLQPREVLAEEAGMEDEVLDVEVVAALVAMACALGDDEGVAGGDRERLVLEVVPAAPAGDEVDLDEAVAVHADGVGAVMEDAHRGAGGEDLVGAPVALAARGRQRPWRRVGADGAGSPRGGRAAHGLLPSMFVRRCMRWRLSPRGRPPGSARASKPTLRRYQDGPGPARRCPP
jgi:hypothetical protein